MSKLLKSGKSIKTIVKGLVLLMSVLVLGFLSYLFFNYESIIRDKLQEALPATVSIDFESIVASPLNRTAEIGNLNILMGPPGHTGRYHSLHIDKVQARGIGIMALLTRDRLTLDNLTIESGEVVLNNVLLEDSTERKTGKPGGGKVKRIEIASLDIHRLAFLMKGDSINECTFNSDMRFGNIEVDLTAGEFSIDDVDYEIREVILDSVVYAPQGGMYRYAAAKIQYQGEQLEVESFSLGARYPKFDFAHKVGKQIDVFDLTVDSLLLAGFRPATIADSLLEVATVEVNGASLHVFRDRRLPFIKDHQEPLPMKVLRDLPYTLRIGSIDLKNTDIVYEEFPEEGTESGSIAFRDIDAHFSGIDNRADTFNSFINLSVAARFMESGLLKAKFAFPMNRRNLYYAEGTLQNFELTDLNPTMEHLARVRIESGNMTSMAFNFDYDDEVSNGSVLLLYEDLEMTALKEKESRPEVNKIKTFILNVLFAKRNKEDEVRFAKRNGTIEFDRDKKRSIFNFWWKSLAAGIKTSNSISEALGSNGGNQ